VPAVPRPRHSRHLAPAILVGAAVVLASCGSDFGAPDGVTEQGENFTGPWKVFFLGAVGVAALIWILVIVAVVRFRRRSDEMPSQRQYNIPFELGYTLIPLGIVAGLFAITVVAQSGFTSTSDDPDVTVEVIGFQWQWQFRYPDTGIVVNGTDDAEAQLILPVGRTVRFELVADDVNHSFWVPEFLQKRDLIPGVDNAIEVEIIEPGTWTGRCAEYCGLDHWSMRFQVVALPGDEYDEWVAGARDLPQPLLSPLELPTLPEDAAS
jgi:cytochrome c oxidase subunit II